MLIQSIKCRTSEKNHAIRNIFPDFYFNTIKNAFNGLFNQIKNDTNGFGIKN